jgi:hypothetical protein
MRAHSLQCISHRSGTPFQTVTSLRLISTTKGLSGVLINLCEPTYTLFVIPTHFGFPVCFQLLSCPSIFSELKEPTSNVPDITLQVDNVSFCITSTHFVSGEKGIRKGCKASSGLGNLTGTAPLTRLGVRISLQNQSRIFIAFNESQESEIHRLFMNILLVSHKIDPLKKLQCGIHVLLVSCS